MRRLFLGTVGLIAQTLAAAGTSTAAELTVEIIQTGKLSCYGAAVPEKTVRQEKLPCETSAAVRLGNRVYLGNDKHVGKRLRKKLGLKGNASLFSYEVTGAPQVRLSGHRLVGDDTLNKLRKIEALAVLRDGRRAFVIGSTSFSLRSDPGESKPKYSTLFYWLVDAGVAPSRPDNVRRILKRKARTAYRRQLLAAFNAGSNGAWQSLQIEGLAALPGRTIGGTFACRPHCLLFGVRKVWRYADGKQQPPHDTLAIIAQGIAIEGDALALRGAPKLIYLPDGNVWRKPLAGAGLPVGIHLVGLSSMAYDARGAGRLLLLTSYEAEEPEDTVGGFLWSLPLDRLGTSTPPDIARRPDAQVLHLCHKPEGLAMLDAKRLMIVYDDDKVLQRSVAKPRCDWTRRPDEAFFEVVEIR